MRCRHCRRKRNNEMPSLSVEECLYLAVDGKAIQIANKDT